MPDDVQNATQQNAQGPSMARGDSGEVRQHTIKDQIAADKYLAANEALKKNHGGIRLVKIQATGIGCSARRRWPRTRLRCSR